jgi:hypothetical protein
MFLIEGTNADYRTSDRTCIGVGRCDNVGGGPANAWQTETVDANDGANPSLAVDSAGLPHISYSTNGDLVHTWNDGSTWHSETLQDYFSNTFVTAIALDSNDHPHIGYHSPQDRAILYAKFDGATWRTEEVVGDIFFIGADEFAFGLDHSGHPHFVYNAMGSDKINYVYHDGSDWRHSTLFTLESGNRFLKLGLALDSTDHPHVCFDDPFANDLVYAYHDGSAWQFETLVDSPTSNPEKCSITLDAQNHPHISYADLGLSYAQYDGSSWHFVEVDSDFAAGTQSSIALTDSNQPRIAYTRGDTPNLGKLLYAVPVGGSWQIETVDTLSGGQRPERFELAVDDANQPHIGYWSYGPTDSLKYAAKEAATRFPLYLPLSLR